MNKILFVRPRGMCVPWQRQCTQPLGILYLTALLKRAGYEIRAVDGLLESDWRKKTYALVKNWQPDFIGISMLSIDISESILFIKAIRSLSHKGIIIGGGPGISGADKKIWQELDLDAAVIGEGEVTILEGLEALNQNIPLEKIAGLSVRQGDTFSEVTQRKPIKDLDQLPFPDQSVLPLPLYFGRPSMDLMYRHPRWASILTSRSCPYNCIYCAQNLGRGFRPRGAQNVMAEIDYLHKKYKIGELQIVDDIFNFDRRRAEEICVRLLSRNFKLHLVFPNGLRLDLLDENLIDLLVKAGMDRVLAPIETASPERQHQIGKHLDLPKALETIRMMVKRGVLVRAAVILGFPGETLSQMKQTVKTAMKSGSHFISFNRLILLPGSRLQMLTTAQNGTAIDWKANFIETNLNLSATPKQKIERLIRLSYLHFLFPTRLLRLWWRMPKNNFGYYFSSTIARFTGRPVRDKKPVVKMPLIRLIKELQLPS